MKDKSIYLAPSLLSADFSQLGSCIKKIQQEQGSFVHIDVMDGTFVSPISFGQPVVKSIRALTQLPFDVHLMVEHPETHLESFSQAGADLITFHWEAAIHHRAIIDKIHLLGKKAGISIVPSTPVSMISEILPFVDLVLVMTVNPGFGGQKFLWDCAEKISWLNTIRQEKKLSFLISVDGGINNETGLFVLQKGADIIVSGSSFFDGSLVFEQLKEEVKK
ncbi:MAG: ribulose-phosphate 3-epimerase [Spirochaetaceae bacterium]|nr:ribulose-phosphate 3-epimerase [Spirochaetaceae bacterium]